MIITFSGHNGSGKTTVAKQLCKELGFSYWGMGDITRAHAKSLGMTIEEHDAYVAKNPKIDVEIDQYTADLSDQKNIIVDARIGWHFLPNSVKICITADEDIRVKRALKRVSKAEEYSTFEEAKKGLRNRISLFENRIRKLYSIEVYDKNNFDLIIDSSQKSVDAIVTEIREYLQL